MKKTVFPCKCVMLYKEEDFSYKIIRDCAGYAKSDEYHIIYEDAHGETVFLHGKLTIIPYITTEEIEQITQALK